MIVRANISPIVNLLEAIHIELPLERRNTTLSKEPLHNDLLEGSRVVHFEGSPVGQPRHDFVTALIAQDLKYNMQLDGKWNYIAAIFIIVSFDDGCVLLFSSFIARP